MTTVEERVAWVADLRNAINSGAIETATRAELTEYATRLCDTTIGNNRGQTLRFPRISDCTINELRVVFK